MFGNNLGTLAGSVNIGPLCPVEPCSSQIDDTYSSRDLRLRDERADVGADDILVHLNQDGSFRTDIPIGQYEVNLSNCEFLGCSSSLPVNIEIVKGETFDLTIDIDTGIRAAVRPPMSLARLEDGLRNAGAEVEAGGDINQPFFSVTGQVLTVNGTDIQVFQFSSPSDAQTEADKVGPDGSPIGTSKVGWVAPPHFYSSGTLIVLYVGDDAGLQTLLENTLGGQFAGSVSDPSTKPDASPDTSDVSDEADSTARRELGARLGFAPDSLRLVGSDPIEFKDGGMGCPDAGAFYTQAIIPGYALLYEVNGARYPFHVSADGRIFTDCRGKNNVAVPFRVADGIVTVADAFRLGSGTASHLGQEIVLKTLDDAGAYLADSRGLVEFNLSLVRWETEMLVGTVITGSGCSFDVMTPSVLMRHLGRTVTVNVSAIQTGLCERAWAVTVWVIVQEVPKDYSASFLLSYVIN